MRSEGRSILGKRVCPSVTTFSATTRNRQVKSDTNRVQRYTGFILKMAIFVKVPRSEVTQANCKSGQAYLDRVRLLCAS